MSDKPPSDKPPSDKPPSDESLSDEFKKNLLNLVEISQAEIAARLVDADTPDGPTWGTDTQLVAHDEQGALVEDPVIASVNALKAMLQDQGFDVELDVDHTDEDLSVGLKVTGGDPDKFAKLERVLRNINPLPGVTIIEEEQP